MLIQTQLSGVTMSITTFSARHRRRAWAAIAVVVLMTAGVALVAAPPAHADPVFVQPGELVVNGDAEQPVTIGWTGALGRATHGVSGYPGSVIVDASGLTGATYSGGSALFTGSGAASVATQTINLAPSAAAIDNGNVDAMLSAYIGGYLNQGDHAALSYDFRDAGGASLATVAFGPVLLDDRGRASGFVPFSATQRLPVGTRQAVLTITTQRFIAPANDGYLDNISLVLDAPSPVAMPDTGSTNQNVPVTLDPMANDTPGAGATLVPSSVRLLDGGTETTALVTAEGSYQVDGMTGEVTFTPIPTYFGITPPVLYRITDSSGQRAQSTIVIDVAFVPAPALSLTKSASPSSLADFTLDTVVTYSFVVTNTGNVAIDDIAIDEVSFDGENPMSVPVCPVPSLDPGEQEVCTATYTLTQVDVDSGTVDNVATATGTAAGPVSIVSPPSAFRVPIAAAPAISLSKTVDAAGASHSGDSVTYSFRVTNTGNVSVDAVTIAEDSFSGTGATPVVSCPVAALLPSQFVSCTANYTLTQADVDSGVVTNSATAGATATAGAVFSLPSSASVIVAAQPSLAFAKTADRTLITAADQLVTYSFTITNTGNVTLSNLTIDDTSFSGAAPLDTINCPATAMAPTASIICTASYTTQAADLDEVTLSNSATAQVSDPAVNTLVSALSSVVIPITPPAVPGTPTENPDLVATGFDPTMPIALGGGLALGGLSLLAFAYFRRIRT